MSNYDVKCDNCTCAYCAEPAVWRVEAWFEEVSSQEEGYAIVCMCAAHLAEFEKHIEQRESDPLAPFYWHGLVYAESVEEVTS